MLKNYFAVSLRNIRKHFSYSLINILGLGLGLATCLLLVAWIMHELSYDRFNSKVDRIYRASLEYSFGGRTSRLSVSPTALAPAMASLPETESVVRIVNASGWSPYIVKHEDKLFLENRFYSADSTFLKIFSYKLRKGNPEKALTEPYSVILTESMAKKYFNNEDPIGKTLYINNKQDYTVTGVIEDAPSNSLFQFDFIGSFNSLRAGREEPIWWSANYQTFVLVHEKADVTSLLKKTNELVKKALASELTGAGDYVRYNFISLGDIHLRSDFSGEPEVVSDIQYVYIFSVVAVLILIIACINYVNLATARGADRAKEVGIRKVVGAVRQQLVTQFIGESMIITFLAFVVALFLAQAMLPYFNDLIGVKLPATLLWEPTFLIPAVAVIMTVGLLAGFYPAFVITSFRAISVLKGNFKTSGKGIWLRRSLVVFQFSISVFLVMATLIIVRQLDFVRSKNLGYDRENTIMLPLDQKTEESFETFKTELLRNGVAEHVGRAAESPVNIKGGYSIQAEANGSQGIITAAVPVDDEYIPAMNMALISGRNFTKEDVERATHDTVYTFILNEAALAAIYMDPKDAIGKKVSMGQRRGEIIGVIRPFHFASLHETIAPLVLFPEEAQFSKVFIKLPKGNAPVTLSKIKEIYNALLPHRPFEFEFLDQQYNALYANEQRLGYVFIVFAALAIIIACLGLLGLVAFSASQRTKEIGVRKVLGATAAHIVLLITRDFSRLVLIAILIGLPIAWWIMSQWLNDFAYKEEIGWMPVLAASAICMLIAFGAAGYQAVKAALIDPAKTLRNE